MSQIVQILFLILLVILIVLEVVGIILYKQGLDACKYKQSPYCYALTCPQTSNNACGGDASRCEDGKLYCSMSPFTVSGTC